MNTSNILPRQWLSTRLKISEAHIWKAVSSANSSSTLFDNQRDSPKAQTSWECCCMLTRASDIWSNSCSETATVANATSMVDAELSQASFLLLSEFASFSACTQRAHPMCQEVLSCKLNEPNVSWSYFLKDSVDWPKQRSQLKFLRRVTHMTPVHANPSCHCTAVSRISHG